MTTAFEPAWLKAARAKLGTREPPGAANNPTILDWVKKLGMKVLGIAYSADSVPWCGLFVAACVVEDGLTPAPIAVRASSWSKWGKVLAPADLALGAVLVFQRPGGGHVGFYVGGNATAYRVLGGNQGDAVTLAGIKKSRCVARRWPEGRAHGAAPQRRENRCKRVNGAEDFTASGHGGHADPTARAIAGRSRCDRSLRTSIRGGGDRGPAARVAGARGCPCHACRRRSARPAAAKWRLGF